MGQDDVVDQLLIAVFARGHCILEGVPGLAKTLMVNSLARSLSLEFNRIQFTPDLMPSDITGTEVLYEDRTSGVRGTPVRPRADLRQPGPGRRDQPDTPKTQAALLEAMQERQVTVGGHRHPLPDPFFVLATQNLIEQEGTYPLPEAQLDRFLFKIFITYPTPEEERRIYRITTGVEQPEITPTDLGRADREPAAPGPACAGLGSSASTTRWTWSARPRPRRTAAPNMWATGSPGGAGPRARAVADPRRARPSPRWPAGPASRSTTFARWPGRCSATGS